jgi:hypothetical protein
MSSIHPDTHVRINDNICFQDQYLSKFALEDLVEFHNAEIELIRGYYYNEGRNPIIQSVMSGLFDKRASIKMQTKRENRVEPSVNHYNPMENILKLIQNSAYGKTIERPHETKNQIVVGRKALDNLIKENPNDIYSQNILNDYDIESTSPLAVWEVSMFVPTDKHFSYPHIGSEILAMSKHNINKVMYLAEDMGIKIYYQDTDSIHIDLAECPRLETAYLNKYHEVLLGNHLLGFHPDFAVSDQNPEDGIIASRSIFLAKKVYIDVLEFCVNGITMKNCHRRCKGATQNAMLLAAGIDPRDLTANGSVITDERIINAPDQIQAMIDAGFDMNNYEVSNKFIIPETIDEVDNVEMLVRTYERGLMGNTLVMELLAGGSPNFKHKNGRVNSVRVADKGHIRRLNFDLSVPRRLIDGDIEEVTTDLEKIMNHVAQEHTIIL